MSHEFVEAGKRYFQWAVGPSDNAMSGLAGWDKFPRKAAEEGDIATIELPMDTRSASSALAGAEAWQGEKDEILKAMSGSSRALHERFGVVDTNLQLDSVAVTRGNEVIFMVPPHNIVETGDELARGWLEQLHDDIGDVLGADPRRDELLHNFQTEMGFLGGEGQQ
jgi:hypothetical protein